MRTLTLRAYVVFLCCGLAAAEVSLPGIVSDHMVLQRDQEVELWGFAAAGEKVRVEFGEQVREAVADREGRWGVILEAMAASDEGRDLTVRGENTVVARDVLVGEVWLCSGQSNMVWTVDGADGADEAKASAIDPRIRMFTGARVSTPEPQDDLAGNWVPAAPDTVGGFSAAAYYFGCELAARLDVPIGLVNVSWGGSTVQAWTTMPALQAEPAAERTLAEYAVYSAEARTSPEDHAGADVDDSGWERGELPGMFKDLGHDIDGVIWFRRELEIPAAWAGKPLTLELGKIDDEDHTYVQGVEVGHTDNWSADRRYGVGAELAQAGAAVLAVRVRDGAGPGGFHSEASAMRIFPEGDEEAAVSLAGQWRLRVASTVSPPPAQHRPAHLYHGMIHPIRRYGIRGVIWYQGENNAIREQSVEYLGLLPAFITDLRAQLGRPELPFIQVQLPNFAENDSTFWHYPVVREAQLVAFRELANVGLAITLDIGDPKNIHPRNKIDVGRRLASWALARTYGVEGIVATGPTWRAATFADDGNITVELDTHGSELVVGAGEMLGGFVVAGEDRVFHPAVARIEDGRVVVTCSAVAEPRALRYAWGNDPADANLTNSEGVPASPFRTDGWELP